MSAKIIKRKTGVVVLLDALGASGYSDQKIKEFLHARSVVNDLIKNLSQAHQLGKFIDPGVYTFGDTIIFTFELRSKKYLASHLNFILRLMRRYLYYSFMKGILFRGAFSYGKYIEDQETNTVMGEAITDAASWYEQAEWMGLHSTPRTNAVYEYYLRESDFNDPRFFVFYDVPLKNSGAFRLIAVSWPGMFFDYRYTEAGVEGNPNKAFLEILQSLPIPNGTEKKYENTREFFDAIMQMIANN